MTVNQKIKKSLKRGDQKKLSEILGVRNQTIAERLNGDKEIDSVDFINAVCKITGKSFYYFKQIEIHDGDVESFNEDKPPYGEIVEKGEKYWKEKFESAQKHIALLEQNIEDKEELIKQLKLIQELNKNQ